MNCNLLVADLFWPSAAGSEPGRDLELPALETLFTRGDRTRTAGSCLARWLAAAFGLPANLPLAPYCLLGDGGAPGEHWWMHADPVHLKLHGHRLILADASRLQLSAEEARELVAALNKHLAREGIEIFAPRPQHWYARSGAAQHFTAAPTGVMAGRSIDAFLPAGEHAARWRRIANEAQMLLHSQPRNDARETAGALPVNSLWFWGAGRLQPLTALYDAVWSDHPLPAGLAAAASVPARPLPATAAEFLAQPCGENPLLVITLPPTAYGEVSPWTKAVIALEHAWCEPLLAALGSGSLTALTLHGLGPDYGYTVKLRPGDRFRFWRRRRPLHDYALRAERRES